MNKLISSKLSLTAFLAVVLFVCLLAWYRYTDDEMNVYISFVNSNKDFPSFNSIVLVGSVDDCGLGVEQNSDSFLVELVRANSIGSNPRDLTPLGHLANVMKASDLNTIANSDFGIAALTGKNPVFLSRVGFDKNHNVAIMCVANGHTKHIEIFQRQGIAKWIVKK